MRYNLESGYRLKSLCEELFGRRAWQDLKHCTNLRVWRKYAERTLSAIEFSAKSTVQIADPSWFNGLHDIVEHGKKMLRFAGDLEELFAILSGTLGQICFYQLGRLPRNATRPQVTLRHESNWKLDQFRSVQYVQSKEQAANEAARIKSLANNNPERSM